MVVILYQRIVQVEKERNIYYVYELVDPNTGMPFYVGKGSHKRMYAHVARVKSGKAHSNIFLHRRLKKLLDVGIQPMYRKIAESLMEQDAYEYERQHIALCRRLKIHLANIKDGGEGGFTHDQQSANARRSNVRQKILAETDIEWTRQRSKHISMALKQSYKDGRKICAPDWTGRSHSEKTKHKMSIAKTNYVPWNKGKHHSQETIDKIRQARLRNLQV
jgi:hypothetical protein